VYVNPVNWYSGGVSSWECAEDGRVESFTFDRESCDAVGEDWECAGGEVDEAVRSWEDEWGGVVVPGEEERRMGVCGLFGEGLNLYRKHSPVP
jgi:hypothetical protein